MRSVLDSRLKTKVILSFKYNLLSYQSLKMIRHKLDRMLLVKSLNALKYYTISQRISTSFSRFRTYGVMR